jgi:hypothetical protein
METLIIAFKDIVVQFFDIIVMLFGAAFVTLGFVYITGRMLEIFKRDKPRNIIAVIFIYGLHYIYTYIGISNKVYNTQLERGWNVFIRGSISIVIYVTICWKLYSRMDSYLDKKFGEDKEETSIPKKRGGKSTRKK